MTEEAPSTRKRLTREESRAQTRDRLLDAAYQILVNNGIEEASIEDIAEAAGFSRGAFYSNFESKDELLCALLAREKAGMQEELQDLVYQTASPAEMIEKVRDYYVDLGANSQRCTFMLASRLYGLRHPTIQPEMNAMMCQDQEKIVQLIQAVYKAAGMEPPCSPDIIAFGLIAVAQGLALTQAADPDVIPKELLPPMLEALFNRITGLVNPPC
jgi:AcrR family transcriptional regulator